jgi:hypothetical protein
MATRDGGADWMPADQAPRGVVVETKIHDLKGERNIQTLKRGLSNDLWWTPDGAMYVYYTPTHYRPLSPPARNPHHE